MIAEAVAITRVGAVVIRLDAMIDGTTISPSMIAEPALMCQASSAIFLKRLVQSLPLRGEDLDRSVHKMDLDAIPIEFDLMYPAVAGWHLLD